MSKMSTEAGALITLSGPTMGTRWTARLAPPPGSGARAELETALAAAVERVDAQMSLWRPDSDLLRLNAAPVGTWVPLPAELLKVLAAALDVSRASGGLFDIGLGGLVRAWGFGPAQGQTDTNAITAHLGRPIASADRLELDLPMGRARKSAPLDIDLAGIAKGFGSDELARVLRAAGLADFLVGIDGEMVGAGRRPDGRPWVVALEAPDRARRAVQGVIELADSAVATSGDYRHFLRVGNGYLSHTMNPRAGGPAQNRIASVSVLAPACMLADAWATVLMVLGETAGPAFARARGIEAIFLLRGAGGDIEQIVTPRGDAAD
jgi:thiamine biosynthesis lipoprotein